jgi:hypothetical protein
MVKRCFVISGNFMQYGQWSRPDPGFVGYIIVDEEGNFEGYMDEKYTKCPPRFVAGVYVDQKMAYYKLVNSSRLTPLVYIFPDIRENGLWAAVNGGSELIGEPAKIKVEALEETSELLEKISQVKSDVSSGHEWNATLISCAHELTNSL